MGGEPATQAPKKHNQTETRRCQFRSMAVGVSGGGKAAPYSHSLFCNTNKTNHGSEAKSTEIAHAMGRLFVLFSLFLLLALLLNLLWARIYSIWSDAERV